ncbi:alpha/beta-hydrolase [Saccharata proteae CBS 121410]|uniref:Alpha/beta-hydrolase n=1 Tax=Saccharata proteae CBS 121410 TaxID=1314787 RepID=A0A6A5YCR5_9PEZI|nr:alpha/beta-hydrolase [Saccharata proteae CBS 121410]
MSCLIFSFLSQPFDVQWRKAIVSLPRVVPDQFLRLTSPEGPHPFVLKLPSRGSHLIPVYVFVPAKRPAQSSLPVILDFHGGGFVLGSCLEQAPFCALMARQLNAIVITVDYRMGPIDQHPAALEDAEDVLSAILDPSTPQHTSLRQGIQTNVAKAASKEKDASGRKPASTTPAPTVDIDTTKTCISGFSSGGNLALELGLSIFPPAVEQPWPSRIPADHAHRIPFLLYYPSLDLRQLPSERTRPPKMPVSKTFWGDNFDVLSPTYLPRSQAAHPRASPGLAQIRHPGLHPMARIYLVLPELDTLFEQSEAWAKKVVDEGRGEDLKVERFVDMKHGWTQMPESWLGDEEKRTRAATFATAVADAASVWSRPTALRA